MFLLKHSKLTVSAYFYPEPSPELALLQVSYQIVTGRLRLNRNHRQEGIPPSWIQLIRRCVPMPNHRSLEDLWPN